MQSLQEYLKAKELLTLNFNIEYEAMLQEHHKLTSGSNGSVLAAYSRSRLELLLAAYKTDIDCLRALFLSPKEGSQKNPASS